VRADRAYLELVIELRNDGPKPCTFVLRTNRYANVPDRSWPMLAHSATTVRIAVDASHRWYDFSVRVAGLAGFGRRLAGHLENGQPSISDPAMAGAAVLDQTQP